MPDITQICNITHKPFIVTEWEQKLLKQMDVPLPTLCIDERHRRRLTHRNERSIHQDVCDLCGKKMISLYSPDKPFTVYCQECWWSDKWDPTSYGRDFDFGKPFFEQFDALRRETPRLSLMNQKGENSEYCNMTTENKNCYLVFGGDVNEDCAYSVFNFYSKNIYDTYFVEHCELCYELIDCEKCYRVFYSQYASNCSDSAFLYACRNVQNCFGCVNLRNKQFHIFNKPYSEEEYRKKIASFRLNTWSGVQKMKKEFETFKLEFPHLYAYIVNSEHSSGDHVINSRNAIHCFDVFNETEDVKDVMCAGAIKDSLSCNMVGHGVELFYEMSSSISGYNCQFCNMSWGSTNAQYCDMVANGCKDVFGCAQLKHAQYCILNKQYSAEEYADLRGRIIEHMKKTGEWGEFLPATFSLFSYNETVANDYYPRTKVQVLAEGLSWREEDVPSAESTAQIPDSIFDTKDEVLQQLLRCETSHRPYKITPQELKFYREMGIPIPRYAPETRNKMRFSTRPPRQTWPRTCMKCGTRVETVFAEGRPEIVYDEKCYLEAVY